MSIPKIYLETTIFNFPFADDAPDKKEYTNRFLNLVKEGKYDPYYSEYVTKELQLASVEKYNDMKNVLQESKAKLLEINDTVEALAKLYIAKKVIRKKKFVDDARHLAISVFYNMDFIVSYNMQHIANPETRIRANLLNVENGYKTIEILNPKEMLDYDEQN